jgi:ribosomal protein S18 acetylase RimI-like enzyme
MIFIAHTISTLQSTFKMGRLVAYPPLMVTCTETVGLTAGHHDVSLWYVVRTSRDRPITFDADEFHSVKWFNFADVPFERSDPHMRRFLHKLSVVTNRDLPKVEVSIAVPSDARLVAEIHVRAWQEACKDILSADYLAGLSIDKRESYWSKVIPKGNPEVLVARFAGNVVGWVAFGKCRDSDATPSAGEIWAIYAAPDHWSTGVGRALWLQARQKLAADGYRTVSLWVLADNAKAIDFYGKAGLVAEPDSAKEFELGGQTLKELRYVANLVGYTEEV